MRQKLRELDGPLLLIAITTGLTLLSARVLLPAEPAAMSSHAMLRASAIYVALVSWQPLVAYALVRRLVADTRQFDVGVRPVALRDSLFSVIVAVVVLVLALAAQTALGRGNIASSAAAAQLSWTAVVQLVITFVVVIAMLWVQAIIEELVWRSYMLPRLMSTFGAWPGLLAHGALWGLCYVPVFAANGSSLPRALGFIVTCGLLGVVLGWLRLSARSIYASAASNATLTVCAGLPAFLIGHGSQLSVALEPPGWLAMIFVIACVLLHRPWRASIAIPWRPTA